MSFNYNHLHYFYQTAKLGGVTAAARSLKVSQPSLSLQLKTLEAQTGIRLFRKQGRNLVLTEDGHRVFGICRTMFEAAEELTELGRASSQSRPRRVTFGVDSEIERSFAAAIVGRFLKQVRPRPNVMMLSGSQAELTERLRAGNIDLLLLSTPAVYSDVLVISKVTVPVKLCCGRRLWNELKGSARSGSLAQFVSGSTVDWVLPSSKVRFRESIDRHLVRRGALGRVVFESDILAAVVRAVSDDIGVSCLPLAYLSNDVRAGKIKLLYEDQKLWAESLYLVTRRGHEKMSFTSEFSRALASELELPNLGRR